MTASSMLLISKADLASMSKLQRLNLVNSLSGYKPANLVGTSSENGNTNLAILSSVIHLSSSPALMGFMQRPAVVPRHTYQNIRETGYFTLNHIQKEFAQNAHYTSAKFEKDQSEFDHCGFTEEIIDDFPAPFVKESLLKIALKYTEEYPIKSSNTILVVGSIEKVYLPSGAMLDNGQLDLNSINSICISGLNNYHNVSQFASFDYARPGSFPLNEFSQK